MKDGTRPGQGISRRQIAIYGKGGIGKSTICANLSAAMALSGLDVIQIGCDPKQDSTRLLLGGRRVTTVLDYLRATSPGERSLESIVHEGFAGVACVEAGGPEPGVGCAGRGILSALDLLESLGVDSRDHDVALYDVLGDVVCGGFAVPLRERYADVIYVVTSGEFMSLYAANNILRGVRNFEEGGPRMGGIVLNRRGLPDEDDRVRRFADAVGLPVTASFPRAEEIGAAERLGQTVIQAFPKGVIAGLFRRMADDLIGLVSPLRACPLSPERLESVVFNGAAYHASPVLVMPQPDKQGGKPLLLEPPAAPPARPRRYHSKSVGRHEVLQGCAFNGAVHTLIQIRDAVTLAHGPRSCAYISCSAMASAVRRAANMYGPGRGSAFCPALHTTEMDERVVIFGGNDSLQRGLERVLSDNPGTVFVVTTCASGIIGDDARSAVRSAADALPEGTRVVTVATDGDINGDYMQGIIDAMIAAADLCFDASLKPGEDTVNIVAEKNMAANTEANYEAVLSLVHALGLTVNCRFIRASTTEELAGFLKGRVNILARADLCGRTIRDYLVDRYGAFFLSRAFPVGFTATREWLEELAALFGRQHRAEEIIERERKRYTEAIEPLRFSLGGKRVFIVTQSYQIDWVLDLAFDLGMEIVKVGILESFWDDDFVTRYAGRFPLALSYTREERDEEIRLLAPDLTLTNALWRGQPEDVRVDIIPILPDAGFESGLDIARRWSRLMRLPPREGWRNDL